MQPTGGMRQKPGRTVKEPVEYNLSQLATILKEEGGTILFIREVADGTVLVRSGNEIVGADGEAFKVGGYYFNNTGVNPNTELGYGTWTQVAQGLLLIGHM